jgi:hypothetical protein
LPLALLDHRAFSTIVPISPNRREQTMALDEAIDILNVLVPIAKAVPILGAPVEGSLEALSKILEFTQVRHGSAYPASLSSIDSWPRESSLPRRKRRNLPFKPLAG